MVSHLDALSILCVGFVNFASMLYTHLSLRYNNIDNPLEGETVVASEYLLKKYKDVKPDEPIQLTKEEKRKNWWHYHRIHILIGVIALAFLGSFVWEMVAKEDTDYQIAYVGEYSLPFDAEKQIESVLEPLLIDRTGDGKVSLLITSYVLNDNDPNAYAAQIALVGDISLGSSSVFLVTDPMRMQETFGIFYQEDGSVPKDETDVNSCMSYAWESCPTVNSLDFGMDLYLIQRGYVNEEMLEEKKGVELLWEVMTNGAEK